MTNDKLKNLFILAETAGPSKASYDYYNEILKKDITNSKAWFGKGVSIGWQSTVRDNNLKEMLNSFRKAIEYATDKESYVKKTADELEKFVSVCITVLINHAMEFMSLEDTHDEHLGEMDSIITDLLDYNNEIKTLCKHKPLNIELLKLLARRCEYCIEFSESSDTCKIFEDHLTGVMKIIQKISPKEHELLTKDYSKLLGRSKALKQEKIDDVVNEKKEIKRKKDDKIITGGIIALFLLVWMVMSPGSFFGVLILVGIVSFFCWALS